MTNILRRRCFFVHSVTVAILSIGRSPAASAQPSLPFEGAATVDVPGVAQTAGLCPADLDKDGRIDLVALSGATARLTVFLNRDDRYVPVRDFDAGASATGCAVGDMNGDGHADVAVSHHDNDEAWVFLGTGAADFDAPKKIRMPVTKPHAHMLLLADANGDRFLDLLLAQADDNQVWLLLGDGTGEFRPSPGSPIPTGKHPYVVTASDFNGDGQLDFATPNWYGKSVSVFLGDGMGRFKEAPGSPIGGFTGPTALSAADLTGDGKIDLAVGNDDSNKVQILVGDGKGSFAVAIPDLEARGDCLAPVLADLNGDGRLDVVATAVNDAPTFSYWINLGDGKFRAAHSLRCPSVASRICVTNVNSDQVADLVVGAWNEPRLFIWLGKTLEK